jgi:hypothetical protein
LVERTSWSYLRCASTSSLFWTNAWLSSNFRGNILIFPLFQSCPSLRIRILSFSAGYSICPSWQDNLLQYRRPNLCLGISIPYSGPTDV